MLDWMKTADGVVTAVSVASTAVIIVGSYVRKISQIINNVHSQLIPNGGSSLRDAVNRVETKLENIESFQHASLAVTGKAYWVSDGGGQCKYASPKLCEKIGAAQDQAIGYGWISYISQEDRDACRAEWINAVIDKREFHMPYSVVSSDGSRHRVIGHAIPMINPVDGSLNGMLGWIEPVPPSQRV